MHMGVVWAIALRYLRVIKKDIGRLFMIFYWPFFDVIIWGFFGKWMQQSHASAGYESYGYRVWYNSSGRIMVSQSL
jgi:hypothetical protein